MKRTRKVRRVNIGIKKMRKDERRETNEIRGKRG